MVRLCGTINYGEQGLGEVNNGITVSVYCFIS